MLRVFVMVYAMICKKAGGALPPAGETFIASASVDTVWTGTQAQYDQLTPDANTLYFIEEEGA